MLFSILKQDILPYMGRIWRHPFNQGLLDGTLPIARFNAFIIDDIRYLKQFYQSLKVVSARVSNPRHQQILMQLAIETAAYEAEMQKKYVLGNNKLPFFQEDKLSLKPMGHAVGLYMQHVDHMAKNEPLPVALASLLPCFYIYYSLGMKMRQYGIASHNPYKPWIESYSSDEFAHSTRLIINVFNEITVKNDAKAIPPIRQACKQSVHHELAFWDSVYNNRRSGASPDISSLTKFK